MKKPLKIWLSPAAAAAPLLLVACAQAEPAPEPADEPVAEQAESQDANGDASNEAAIGGPDARAEMPVVNQTGWRVQGEDGAVYTTFFDADGTYRDFKNGEPVLVGTWEERVDGKLCFTPAEKGRIGECWQLSPVSKDGMMKPVSDAGKAIELRQVTYIAPVEES